MKTSAILAIAAACVAVKADDVQEWVMVTPPADANTGCIDGSDFFFWVKQGANPKRLAVNFEGGGGCWDTLTCSNLGQGPFKRLSDGGLYTPNIDPSGTHAYLNMGLTGVDENGEFEFDGQGIHKPNFGKNPLNSFTQVYVPYCTGDLHAGTRTAQYPGLLNPATGEAIDFQHNGQNNVNAVKAWIADNFDAHKTKRVVVTGGSAGAVGALFHAPAIWDMFPEAKVKRAIVDGYVGVLSEYVKGSLEANWGVSYPIAATNDRAYSEDFSAQWIGDTIAAYPDASIALFTDAFDTTQYSFWTLGFPADVVQGVYQPPEEWFRQMLLNLNTARALGQGNVVTYLDDGDEHMSTFDDKLYTIKEAGVKLVKWYKKFVKGKDVVEDVNNLQSLF